MSEKDHQNLTELARKQLREGIPKEEGFRLLVKCGLIDEDGNLIHPEIAPYLAAIPSIPSISDGTCTT